MDLGYSITNGVVVAGTSATTSFVSDSLRSLIGSKSNGVKFYWNKDMGGGIVKTMTGIAASETQSYVLEQYKNMLYKKEREYREQEHRALNYNNLIEDGYVKANKNYGKMEIKGGTVVAVDPYGNKCIDAIMLKIPSTETHIYRTRTDENGNLINKDYSSEAMDYDVLASTDLVWWDCTALVTINSEKNLILTKVQGRDYSRKELVSNGDINFSVTGHILSIVPDVYPAEEVQKFIEVMQYKGWVEVNNEVLDQFNIEKIVIKDFQMTPNEGSKARVDYTFNAVGVMPKNEVIVNGDSIKLLDSYIQKNVAEDNNVWKKLLEEQIEKLKQQSVDALDDGMATASGLAMDAIDF